MTALSLLFNRAKEMTENCNNDPKKIESALPVFTVRQFSQRNPAFSEASLRFQLFNRETNGLIKSGAVLTMGGKILIHEPKFMEWLQSGTK
ncbi:hypothetical protein [Methylomonas sp. MgM2]